MSSPDPASIPLDRRIVVVSHLLPIHLSKDMHGKWVARWDEEISTQGTAISRYTALGVRRLPNPVLFVGSPHIYVPPAERPAVEAAIAAAGIDCALVHLKPSVASRFYQGFCKATLWPTLHNVLDVYNNASIGAIIDAAAPTTFIPKSPEPTRHAADEEQPWQQQETWNPIEGQEECWADYQEVNRLFARTVVENYCDGDLIWVQHYHLLLAPNYLERKLRTASIGNFARARPCVHARRAPRCATPPPHPCAHCLLLAVSVGGRLRPSVAGSDPTRLVAPTGKSLRYLRYVNRLEGRTPDPTTRPHQPRELLWLLPSNRGHLIRSCLSHHARHRDAARASFRHLPRSMPPTCL